MEEYRKRRKLTDATRLELRRQYSSDSILQEFAEWVIDEGGYIADCLSIERDRDHGVGFRLTSTITTDSAEKTTTPYKLLSCPKSIVFTLNTPRPHLPEALILSTQVTTHAKLVLHFCSHILLKEQSSHWLYIRTLPTEFHTPLWFSKDDKAWLVGTNLGSGDLDKRCELWKQEWKDGVAVLKDSNVENHEQYTWDLYLRAATVFTSRSFTSKLLTQDTKVVEKVNNNTDDDAQPVLVPLWDITNHKPRLPIIWKATDETMDILTPEDVTTWKIGRAVENNYGPKSNEELLMGYGFCIEDNPVDTVAMKLAVPPLNPDQVTVRAEKSSTKDWQDVFFISHVPKDKMDDGTELLILEKYWPESVVDLFRLCLGTPTEETHFQEQDGMVSTRNELSVALQLELALRAKLAKLTDITREAKSINERMAKIYRDGQRKIMESNITYLKFFIENYNSADRKSLRQLIQEDENFVSSLLKVKSLATFEELFELDEEEQECMYIAFIVCQLYKYQTDETRHTSNKADWWTRWFDRICSEEWYDWTLSKDDFDTGWDGTRTEFIDTEYEDLHESWIRPIRNGKIASMELVEWVKQMFEMESVLIHDELYICL